MSAILFNNKLYGVGGGGSNGNGTEIESITYAQYLANKAWYDASDNMYWVSDYPNVAGEAQTAEQTYFDDTTAQLGANDVQGAIDTVNSNMQEISNRTETLENRYNYLGYNQITGDTSILATVQGLTKRGIYAFTAQNATDAPLKGNISFIIVNFASQQYNEIYYFCSSKIYRGSCSPSTTNISWTQIV